MIESILALYIIFYAQASQDLVVQVAKRAAVQIQERHFKAEESRD